jgi:hypothetical protein
MDARGYHGDDPGRPAHRGAATLARFTLAEIGAGWQGSSVEADRTMNPVRTDGATSAGTRTGGSVGGVFRAVVNGFARTLRRFEGIGLALADWPSARATSWINAAQVLAWTALALAVLPGRGHFTYDQAYFYELSVRVAESLRPNGYGPFVSESEPAVMTPGGGVYLVYSIPFFFFRDPRIGVGWIILLSACGLLLMDRFLVRLGESSSLRFASVSLLTWSLWHARFTDTFWNANLFLFSTPALLYVAVRNAQDAKPTALWAILFGLLSALSLQIHASGVLAIFASGLLWATQRPESLQPRRLGLVLCGLLAAYLPYFWVELRDGWVNSRALSGAVRPGFDKRAIGASLGALLLYPSHVQSQQLVAGLWRHSGALFSASLLVAAVLSVLGFCVRFKSKMTVVLVIAAIPLYFRFTGRHLYDHYLVCAMPILCLPAVAGTAWLLSRRVWRWFALTYLALFAIMGIVILLAGQERLRPGDPWNGHTFTVQLERTRRAILTGGVVRSGTMDEGALVQWVIARRLLGHRLMFEVGPYFCDVTLRLSGLDPPAWTNTNKSLVPLAPNSLFMCESRQ